MMKLIKTLQWKVTLREAVWLIVLSLALACGSYFLRPGAMSGVILDEGVESDNFLAKAIAFEDAVDHFKNGTAIFADARSLGAFEAGHIKGAVHLDPSEFDQWSEEVFSYDSAKSIFITYCESSRCLLSRELAEKLTWLGFENVYSLQDGWELWKEHRLPMAKGQAFGNIGP